MAQTPTMSVNPPAGEVLWRERRFELRVVTLPLRDGRTERRGLVVHPGAAVILPVLDDGSVVRVGYDGQNGHSYVSIGRKLIDYGEMELEQVSMQSIRAWLAAHPERAEKLLATNPSFIFFREIPVEDSQTGPPGAQGVALTPERSLAVDRAFMALGVPLWLDTTEPAETPDSGEPLRRLVLSQDTGGAIQGPVRGDFFWGFGRRAEEKAGRMKQPGRYYVLLPKSVRPHPSGEKDS